MYFLMNFVTLSDSSVILFYDTYQLLMYNNYSNQKWIN